jgi:hypothetical protein
MHGLVCATRLLFSPLVLCEKYSFCIYPWFLILLDQVGRTTCCVRKIWFVIEQASGKKDIRFINTYIWRKHDLMINTTFNNISAISWRSVLLVEETGVPGENHRPVASHWQTLSHNVVSITPSHELGSN